MRTRSSAIVALLRNGTIAMGAFLLLSGDVSAQELQVSGGKAWLDHDLLGAPLGVEIALGVQVAGGVGVRLGYEGYRDRFGSFGSTCVGLVSPDEDCDGEARRDRARMSALTLGGVVSILRMDRATVALLPAVRTGSVSSSQTGERTGRARSAEKRVYGLELGGELRVRVHPGQPLFVHLRGSVGSLRRWTEEHIADGYTPFEEPVRFATLELGVSVRR